MDLTELRQTISLCKESIISAEFDLTKLTGRDFHARGTDGSGRGEGLSRGQRETDLRRNLVKRHWEENDQKDDSKRPKTDREVHSLSSVVQMTKGRTRHDALLDLKIKENPKEKERCKRLFGHLMGTLNSIKKESEKSSNDLQQLTRLKIEKKVEEDHKLINETIKREQNELIRAKKERQNDLKNLNQRYRAAEAFERWRQEKEKMKGFIRTSKQPFIFYKPNIINEETQLRINQTARDIDLMIETKKKKLETEIERVVKRHIESTGSKQHDEINAEEDKLNESFNISVHSVKNKMTVSRSHASSFASEDYDDMVEEIEIAMHDEQIHEEEDHEAQNESMVEDSEVVKDEPYTMEDERVVVKCEDSYVAEERTVQIRGEEEEQTPEVQEDSLV